MSEEKPLPFNPMSFDLIPPVPSEGDAAEFELHCNGNCEASTIGPRDRAWREILHYATQYSQDGPIEIYEVKRTLITDYLGRAVKTQTPNGKGQMK